MSPEDFKRFIAEVEVRFEQIGKRIAADKRRPPGDQSTSYTRAMFEIMQGVAFEDAMIVIKRIFSGDLAKPYADDFAATVRSHALRAMHSRKQTDKREDHAYKRSAEQDHDRYLELEKKFGASFDAWPEKDRIEFAENALNRFLLQLWRKRPMNYLARYHILETLEQCQ